MDKRIFILISEYWKDPIAKISLLTIALISVLIALLYSTFSAFTVACSYISGCIVCWLIILYKDVIFKFLPQFCTVFGYKGLQKTSSSSNIGKSLECDLCNNGKCLRHKPRPIKEPWNNLYLHRDLDLAIRKLYEKILSTFVTGWYKDVCNDKRFEYAVKRSLKYATSIVLRRVKQIDFPVLLMDKLLPRALSHLHGVSRSMQSRTNSRNSSDSSMSNGDKFIICAKPYVQHYALKDRTTEIEYLRSVTEKLMPMLIDKEDHECRNFITLIREIFSCWVLLPLTDCLADPSIINNIIISLFNNSGEYDANLKNKQVLLLNDFCVLPKSLTFLQERPTLALLLKNNTKLYCFMKYLKRTDRINLLQFCLHVDDMNNMLMKPTSSIPNASADNKQKHLTRLQNSIKSITSIYLRTSSSDQLMQFVYVTPKQIKDIEAVSKIDPENIGLATVAPIYELYDKVFSYLDGLLNEFYTSPEYLELLYGPKNQIEAPKTSINSTFRPRQHPNQTHQSPLQLSQSQSRLSNISTKIKGALRGSPVDGQLLPNSSFYTVDQTHYPKLSDYVVKVHSIENSNGTQAAEVLFRVHCEVQLYALQNSMLPNYSQMTPHNVMQTVKEKAFHTLRSDIGSTGEWDVLPDARTHALEERRLSYELFLQSLVANKSLSRKQQERIASFLIPPTPSGLISSNVVIPNDENDISGAGMASDGNIGANLYQSVAHKLRKERGQHLQCFTSALFKSVQESGTNSSNQIKIEDDTNNENVVMRNSTHSSDKLFNKRLTSNRFSLVFGDHFRESQRFDGDECFHCSMPSVVRGPSQCLLFLLVRLLHAPKLIIRIVLALSNFFGTFLDKIINYIIQKKIVESSEFCEIGLASLINMLTDTLFPAIKAPKIEKSVIASNNTLLYNNSKKKISEFTDSKRLRKYWPELNQCLQEMHKALQHPTLNKQLVYSLFDIALVELFPEITNVNS